jgi:hypothetical protein
VYTPLPIAVAFVGLLLIAGISAFEPRKTPAQEAEVIRRQDEAMSRVKDDPHESARWVP